jgi:hypothetical protein
MHIQQSNTQCVHIDTDTYIYIHIHTHVHTVQTGSKGFSHENICRSRPRGAAPLASSQIILNGAGGVIAVGTNRMEGLLGDSLDLILIPPTRAARVGAQKGSGGGGPEGGVKRLGTYPGLP